MYDYSWPITLGQRVTVAQRITDIGRSSIHLDYEVRADGDVAATAEVVLISYDREEQAAQLIPTAWWEESKPTSASTPPLRTSHSFCRARRPVRGRTYLRAIGDGWTMAYDTLKADLRGVAFTTPTPFTPESLAVDHAALRDHIWWLGDAGARMLVPCGNTGEYYALEPAERSAVVDAGAGVGSVVGGIGGVCLLRHGWRRSTPTPGPTACW